MKRTFIIVFLFICFVLLPPSAVRALSPVVQYQDLVAGNGESGYKDGAFYSAEFNQPTGIVLNADESVIYVADKENNLIRAVLLKEKNKVITIAGSVDAGRQDGPLTVSSFNQPKDLVFLPNDRIAVFDLGNQLIRLVDLKKKAVSTVAGGGKTGQTEGEALKVQLGAIWNLVYYEKDSCLYFSVPDQGVLQRLDLDSGEIETVLKNNPFVPHPKALCVANGKFYVSDSQLQSVYEFLPPPRGKSLDLTVGSNSNVNLKPVCQSPASILGLAGSGKVLYAYQPDLKFPIYRLFPNPGPVSFVSGWGFLIAHEYSGRDDAPGQLMPALKNTTLVTSSWGQIGFIFDPRSVGRFYVTNLHYSIIAAIKDNFAKGNPDGLTDLEYPYSKPVGTFRILICGRSYLNFKEDERVFYEPEAVKEVETRDNVLITLAKHMEVELNTQSALDDNPIHFQVLDNCLRVNNLLDESYYTDPDLCAKYDFDLVLILQDDQELQSIFQYLLVNPVDSDGIPVSQLDPEFILKPNMEKSMKTYPDFIQYLLSKKLVVNMSNRFPDFYVDDILRDSKAREMFLKIQGQPLKMLKKKMNGMRTSGGKVPQLVFCYFDPGGGDGFFTNELQRSFWRDLCQEEGVAFVDLCDDFAVLGMTYHPYSVDVGHFTPNGMNLFNRILLFELNRNKIIPTKPPDP